MVPPPLSLQRIVYEDDCVLVVDKPAGLVAHATVDPGRDHLLAAVGRMLDARDGAVGHLHLVHRLDRDTSGLLVLSRCAAWDGELGAAFAERTVRKTYAAIVRETAQAPFPAGDTELRDFLAPGKGAGGRTRAVRSGGRPSRTTVRAWLRDTQPGLVLVQATPHTGRTHQIRVHLANLGYPIVGDTLYGTADPQAKRMMLHARALMLVHPRTRERLSLLARWPRAFRARFSKLARTPQ